MSPRSRTSSKDLAFLRLLLTSGIDVMTQMPVLSEALKRLIPSFSLSMIRVDERCAPQQHYSEFFDDFSHQLFAQSGHVFAARSDDPAAFGNLLRNRQPYGTLIGVSPAYLAGDTYQHLFRRNGIHHALDVAMRDAQGPLGILGIFREENAPAFSPADLVVIHELYPYLVGALRAPSRPGPHDEVQGAMMVLDRKGKVQWASDEARVWLHDVAFGPDRSLLLDADTVPQACIELARRWQQHRALRSTSREVSQPPELTLSLPGGRLRLRAYGLSGGVLADGTTEAIGVQLGLEMHRGLRVLCSLHAGTLTAQQQRIAYALWCGKRPAEICADMEIGPGTLKAYLKDLYRRLDVSSAPELVSLLDERGRFASLNLLRHRPARHEKNNLTPRGE